jgi:hypothetical protein
MWRFYIKFAIGSICLFICVGLASGNNYRIPPALRSLLEPCPDAPCWNGLDVASNFMYIDDLEAVLTLRRYVQIEEGVHNVEPNYRIYLPDAESGLCTAKVYYSSGDAHLIQIDLYDCANVHVIDIVRLFGIPNTLYLNEDTSGALHFGQWGFDVLISKLAPGSLITAIVISPGNEGGPYFSWHGYAPFWVYCTYEPNYDGCASD